MIIKRKRNKFRIISWMLTVTALLLFAAGAGIALLQYKSNQTANHQAEQAVQAANGGQPSDAPSTVEPGEDEFRNYKVLPSEPRYIFIPSLSVKAMVKPMGRNDNNQIQAPINIHHAGWFIESAKPGEIGVTVVDGHASDWSDTSIFHNLKQLQPGDEIIIERGDGQKLTYIVSASQNYPADEVDMNAALSSINPKKPGLNLITCDGKIIKGNEYDKRLIVFAEQR